MKLRAMTLAIALIGGFVAVTATPSGAQQPADVTGSFECTSPGTFTVTWMIQNLAGADGEVDSAVLSGAAEGDITDSFTPNPFTGEDQLIVGSSVVSGDTVGDVTLDVTIIFDFKGPFEFDDSAEVVLDGSCEAPPTTEPETTSSTSTSVQQSTATRPSFTG
jgi:hypothetical protein